jgi:hypothetical protein
MLEDKDTEEFKKTVKRLQEDYQLELELENERVIEPVEKVEDTDERVDDAESEEDK